MIYRQIRPGPPLDEHVEWIWYCADYRAEHRREVVLPSGSAALILALGHDRLPDWGTDVQATQPVTVDGPALVAGVSASYRIIDTAALDSLLGVHFRPCGAMALLGAPVGTFSEAHTPIDLVWGRAETARLREEVASARTPEAKLRCAERALLRRLRMAREPGVPAAVRFAVDQIDRAPQIATVAGVSERCGLSTRRLGELFRVHVGLTPKTYCRLRRFRLALERMNEGREIDWASLAVECGYYDQPHFLHDFKRFSGMNPSAYKAGRGAWKSHVKLE